MEEVSWYSEVAWYWLLLAYLAIGMLVNFISHLVLYRATGKSSFGGRDIPRAMVGVLITAFWPIWTGIVSVLGSAALLIVLCELLHDLVASESVIQKANVRVNKVKNIFRPDDEKD